MPVLQNLYQVYKIPSNKLIENNRNLANYTRREAVRDGCLVSIGDNILFHKIREYRRLDRPYLETYNKIKELRTTLRMCKKNGDLGAARVVNQQINDILFVKDIINVSIVKKSDYQILGTKGFDVNGIHYIRFLVGAGQMRRNTITFINEELFKPMHEALMCGLENKIKEINLAKLSAYFALSFSSVLWVREPRCCVIKDFETIIPNQKVDYICKKKNEDGSEKRWVEERVMDLPLNSADGQGLIDPEFSNLWAQDMNLDYTPSSFVVRSAFIKGNMVPFDFKAYAAENGITTITDKWGNVYNINDVDVLLSESQFKMHKYYDNWNEYLENFHKYNLRWGVARYNRKYDDENVLANYQYIQVLNITQDDVKELVKPTIDWINNVCSGKDLYSLLYLFGPKNEDINYKKLYGCAQTNFAKAIVKNNKMLKDSYVQKKIYRNIIETINRAKIGKIWIKGNYQFMISDPIAQCRFALGLDPKGEIPANNIWSNFWNERRISGYVDVCRSPQIDISEHSPSKLYSSKNTDKWYQYIKSGVVLSIYDIATLRLADADFD